MPAPVFNAGTLGNVINAVSVAPTKTIAAFLDLGSAPNAEIEGQLVCEVVVGATAPTAGTTFSIYDAYCAGAGANTTLSSGASAGAATINVVSKAGLNQGQKIAVQQAGGSKLGEVVTITGAITGTGPYAVPVSATINSYSTGDNVYLFAQTPLDQVTPSSPTNTWAANSDYSSFKRRYGTGQYVVAANNADGSATVTVSAHCDFVQKYQ
jgi:hypothetical protein